MKQKDIKQNAYSLLCLLDDVNWYEVLEVAETVASFAPLPYLPGIIKGLRHIVRFQPLLKTGISVGKYFTGDSTDKFSAMPAVEYIQQSGAKDIASLITPPARMVSQKEYENLIYYLTIANDDNVITEEECNFLLPIAQEAGYTKSEFEVICQNINKSNERYR